MYILHIIATCLHIISAIYWIGAILFILTALGPVLRQQPSIIVPPIMTGVHERVRKNVFIAIIIFVITGIFNMYYRGLFDTAVLIGGSYGRTFLLKMFPVAIMFTLYFSAPALMKRFANKNSPNKSSNLHHPPHYENLPPHPSPLPSGKREILIATDEECKGESACCEMEEGHKPGNKVFAVLHIVALACGFLAVFLGVLLRG